MLNSDLLVSAINTSPETGLVGFAGVMIIILVFLFAGVYCFGKYYQLCNNFPEWKAGFTHGVKKISNYYEKAQPVNPFILLTFEEATELAEDLKCFVCPIFTGDFVTDGIYYLTFSYSGVNIESKKNCALYVKNTIRKFYRKTRYIDIKIIYIRTLTKSNLCVGIAGNTYGEKQIAPLVEKQQVDFSTK